MPKKSSFLVFKFYIDLIKVLLVAIIIIIDQWKSTKSRLLFIESEIVL